MSLTIGPIRPPQLRLAYDRHTARFALYNLTHAQYTDTLYFFHHWEREFGRGEGTAIHKRASSIHQGFVGKIDGLNGENNLLVFSTHHESDFVVNLIDHLIVPLLHTADPELGQLKDDAMAVARWFDAPWESEPQPNRSVIERTKELAMYLGFLLDDPIGVAMLKEQGRLLLKR